MEGQKLLQFNKPATKKRKEKQDKESKELQVQQAAAPTRLVRRLFSL